MAGARRREEVRVGLRHVTPRDRSALRWQSREGGIKITVPRLDSPVDSQTPRSKQHFSYGFSCAIEREEP